MQHPKLVNQPSNAHKKTQDFWDTHMHTSTTGWCVLDWSTWPRWTTTTECSLAAIAHLPWRECTGPTVGASPQEHVRDRWRWHTPLAGSAHPKAWHSPGWGSTGGARARVSTRCNDWSTFSWNAIGWTCCWGCIQRPLNPTEASRGLLECLKGGFERLLEWT